MDMEEIFAAYKEAVITGNATKAITLMPSLLPPKLYHFTSFSEYWYSKIIQGQLFLSNPALFNDPYDCRIQGNKEYWIDNYLLNHSVPNKEQYRKDLLDGTIQLSIDGRVMTMTEYTEKACNEYKEHFRIACLSEVRDSMLMWSHYAGMHSGYALELDTSRILLSALDKIHLRKVVYDTQPITIEKLMQFTNKEPFLLCKSPEWEYEKEWRYFAMQEAFWDISNYITAIYIGSRFDTKRHFHELRTIQKHCQEYGLKLYKMELDDASYKLIPKDITTTTIIYE